MTEREERSARRRQRIVAHRAHSFEEADAWDLDYWQALSPEERLAAHVAILRDVELVREARRAAVLEDPVDPAVESKD